MNDISGEVNSSESVPDSDQIKTQPDFARQDDSGFGRPCGPKRVFPVNQPKTAPDGGVSEHEPIKEQPNFARRGDSGFGRPRGPQVSLPPIVDSTPESDLEFTDTEDEKFFGDDIFLPWVGKALRGLIFPIAAIAGFFIVIQTASFLVSVRKLPLVDQILLIIPVIIFGGLAVWYILKMFRLWWKLRVSPQIQLKAMRELANRKELRELSTRDKNRAVSKLKELLEDERAYAGKEFRSALKKFATSPDEFELIEKLEVARKKLIDDATYRRKASSEWLKDFEQNFQKLLDEIAGIRIRKYYFHAGIMTAISPYPLMDRLIVLRVCLAMLKDLLEIYALKPSWDKSLVLLAKVIIKTYLAGVIDKVAGEAAEHAVNNVIENIPALAATTAAKGICAVVSKGAGKGAGMLVQAVMVYRLGQTTIKMLRPIQDVV